MNNGPRKSPAVARRSYAVVVLFLISASVTSAQVPVPERGAYHAAFVDERGFASPVDAYESFATLSGKPLAIAMLYRSWSMYTQLDLLTMHDLREAGMVPHITWEPWWGNRTDQTYSNQRIIDGLYDDYLRLWAADLKRFGHPVMIRWAHEMNGDWYPWAGIRSGGATLDGFGEPDKADGPERYIAAYRHIHQLFADEGVANVDWIWCPNNGSAPDQPWNQPEAYYPGDDFVDWVCIDGYNWGAATYDWGISGWASFVQLFKPTYDRLKVYGKPIMIGEFASAEVGGDKAQWISDAYAALRSPVFGLVKAVTWFHIDKETDWRVDSSPRALDAYRGAVANEFFLGAVPTSTGAACIVPPSSEDLQVFPNPTTGSFSIRSGLDREGVLRVYDLLGRMVAERVLGHGGLQEHRIDHPLSAGTYLIRIEDFAGRRMAQKPLVVL